MLIKPKKIKNKRNNTSSLNNTTTTTTTTSSGSTKLTVLPNNEDIILPPNEKELHIKKTYENFYTEFPTLKEIYRGNRNHPKLSHTVNENNDKYFRKNLEGIKSKINQNFKDICEKTFCNCDSKFLLCFCENAVKKAGSSLQQMQELDQLKQFKDSIKDVENNWKKRDILYYCFIQRDNEVSIIWDFIQSVCDYYRIEQNSLLDIGCGLGRMFDQFAKSKFQIIEAFEPDEDYYSFAYNYSKNTCDRVDVYKVGFLDMMEIMDRYNLITTIHGPLQYLYKLEDRIAAMKKIYNALVPGGVAIVDVSNFMRGLSNILNNKQQKMLINGSQVIRTSTIHTDEFNCLWNVDDIFYSVDGNHNDDYGDDVDEDNGSSTCYSNGNLLVEEHKFAIISKSELQLLFMSTGFINIKWSSEWNFQSFLKDGGKVGNQGARIIMVGQKPIN